MIFSNVFKAYFALFIAMFLWASSFIGLKLSLSVYTPFEVIAGRMIVASIFCLPLLKEVIIALKDKKNALIIILGVLFEPCIYFLCETFALHYTSASQAGMVLSLNTIFIGIGACIFLKEKLSIISWIGFFIAMLGIIWLSLGGEASASAPNPLFGNFLELGAVFCAVGYTLCVRYITQTSVKPLVFTAAMAFGGAIFYIPLTFLPIEIKPLVLDVEIATWIPFVSIIYLGFAVSLIGYGGYNYSLKYLKASEVAPFLNLIPIITIILGVLFIGEEFKFNQYLASGLVIIGIVLSQISKK